MIKILCYCEFSDQSITEKLGAADYSYFYVQQAYIPVLEKLGDVVVLDSLQGIHDHANNRLLGSVIVLAFVPPHKLPDITSCPVIPVFAWEYNTLPNIAFWGNPKNDWTVALKDVAAAITHSSFSQKVVQQAMGGDLKTASIPAPIWDAFEDERQAIPTKHPYKNVSLDIEAEIVDSDDFDITNTSIKPRIKSSTDKVFEPQQLVDGEVFIDPSDVHSSCKFVGFSAIEEWGIWSISEDPWIMLPYAVHGELEFEICAHAVPSNAGLNIEMIVGDARAEFVLQEEETTYVIRVTVTAASRVVGFRGLSTGEPANDVDTRKLGMGLHHIKLKGAVELPEGIHQPSRRIDLSGMVYTYIFNFGDGRKNWDDALIGFCRAFQKEPNATYIMKVSTNNFSAFLYEAFKLLRRLQPYQCRVVILYGYLSNETMADLRQATTFVVNNACGEGQCLPLMEYMAAGIPAVAPNNTAMTDYLNENNSFRVDCSLQPDYWPTGPKEHFRTQSYRIHWQSLFEGLQKSYQVAIENPEHYRVMAAAAAEAQRLYCSQQVVEERLAALIKSLQVDDSGQPQQGTLQL